MWCWNLVFSSAFFQIPGSSIPENQDLTRASNRSFLYGKSFNNDETSCSCNQFMRDLLGQKLHLKWSWWCSGLDHLYLSENPSVLERGLAEVGWCILQVREDCLWCMDKAIAPGSWKIWEMSGQWDPCRAKAGVAPDNSSGKDLTGLSPWRWLWKKEKKEEKTHLMQSK